MRRGQRHKAGRAISCVIALYALLLQAFLGFATPSLALGPDGVLCVEHGSAPPDGKSAGHHDHQCCLPVQHGAMAPPPELATVAAWQRPTAHVLAWRPEADLLTTGPPGGAHQPRGPPLA